MHKEVSTDIFKISSSVCVTIVRGLLKASRRGVIKNSEKVKFELSFKEQRIFQDTKMAVDGAFHEH